MKLGSRVLIADEEVGALVVVMAIVDKLVDVAIFEVPKTKKSRPPALLTKDSRAAPKVVKRTRSSGT